MEEFKDYFSEDSEDYRKFRPTYPAELFSYLASLSNHHHRAWDCATGNGQSAQSLSNYFTEIIATDASNTQIKNAIETSSVTYRVATAENSGIESKSIDLITVAQALHWFNMKAFSNEANRVLKEGGIIAVWSYNLFSMQENIDRVIENFYGTVLEDFWPKERKIVESGYRNIQLPFKEIEAPIFTMSEEWNLSQLMGYLCTWSATKKYQKKLGISPVEKIHQELLSLWKMPEKSLPIRWSLNIRLWQKNITDFDK
jgi:SAM-dependent methyltransferase